MGFLALLAYMLALPMVVGGAVGSVFPRRDAAQATGANDEGFTVRPAARLPDAFLHTVEIGHPRIAGDVAEGGADAGPEVAGQDEGDDQGERRDEGSVVHPVVGDDPVEGRDAAAGVNLAEENRESCG